MTLKPIRIAACAAAVMMMTGIANAGEKKLMHCFAFTSVKEATPAQWDAFFKASDALPGKIKGVTHVWYGKLARPLSVGTETRDWGMCMEMASPDVRKAYGSDPYHQVWDAAYSKVRVEGTTTFDILGQ